MDTRRSYYLASRQDDFDFPSRDGDWVADIPYIMPANETTINGPRTVYCHAAALCSTSNCPAQPQMIDPLP